MKMASTNLIEYVSKIINELLLVHFEKKRNIFTGNINDTLSEEIFSLYYPTKKFPKLGKTDNQKKKTFMTISTGTKTLFNNILLTEFIKEFIVSLRYYMKIGFENNVIINIVNFKELIIIDKNFTYLYDMSLLEYLHHLYIHQNYYELINKNILKIKKDKKIKNIRNIKNGISELDNYVLKILNLLDNYNKDLYNTIFDNIEEKKYLCVQDKIFETFNNYILNFILYLSYELFNYCQCFTKIISPINIKYDVFIYILTIMKTPYISLNDKLIVSLRIFILKLKEENKQKNESKTKEIAKIKANKEENN
jgi:hypothetical protein